MSYLRFLFLVAALQLLSGLVYSAETLESLREGFIASPTERLAGAVVLRQRIEAVVDGKDSVTKHIYVAVAILDQQAASDYSRIRETFNSYYDQLQLKSARLIDASGTEHGVAGDAVQIKTSGDGLAYDDLRTLAFSLPAVSPGSFLEYELELKTRRPVMPGYWYFTSWFNNVHPIDDRVRLDPVRETRFTLSMPADQSLRIDGSAMKYQTFDRRIGNRRELAWIAKNIPQLIDEDHVPDFYDAITYLDLSNIPEWRLVDDWADAIYNQAALPSPSVKKLTAGLLRPGMNETQKAQAIFYWVQQQIRYIRADLKRGGIVPHSASKILSNRFGDCKDQAVLMVSMLRAAGIDAEPVLISPAPRRVVSRKVPSIRFNHMIVRAELDGGLHWLDTSGDAGAFPGLDSALLGQRAFVIDGEGGKLVDLPEAVHEDNQLTIHIDYFLRGDELRARVKIITAGAFDHRFRVLLHSSPKFREELREILTKTASREARLEDFSIQDVRGSGRPLEIDGELIFADAWSTENQKTLLYSGSLASTLALFSPLMNMPDQKRTMPFSPGLPAEFHLRVTCPSPGDDYRQKQVSGDLVVDRPEFQYARKVQVGLDKVVVSQDFVSYGKPVAASAYLGYRSALRQTVKRSDWYFVFEKDEGYRERLALQKKLSADSGDQKTRLELARRQMAEGEYELARDSIQQVISLQPKNGEAQYLLGLVLGFLDEFDAADRALARSEELGFRP